MEITFLGAAKEVGASSVLIKTAGRNILLDAGIKVNEDGAEALPDLSILEKLQKNGEVLDAVIISHAHLDHCGALPVVNRMFPETKIYCTPSTKALMQVMLDDALKVARTTSGLTFYSEEDIDRTLSNTVTAAYGTSQSLAENVGFVLLRAGHVLGAAGILIQSDEGTVLYTGDYTLFSQRTIEGQDITRFLKNGVNIIITEGTYGSRIHEKRSDEINKMIEVIENTVEKGGKVLIPAFALGRAQEVILAIKDRKDKKYPVYVDGMVKKVNSIYRSYSNYLTRQCYNEIKKTGSLFYTQEIIEVEKEKDREKVMNSSEPYVVIASSGMLTGGLSPVYAEKIIDDKKNAIIIVGYQDEESPGRKLLELAENNKANKKIILNGIEREVKCRVEKAQLSAHSDKNDIIFFLESIPADYIYLVHGDEESLTELYNSLRNNQRITAHIEIAERNKTYTHNLPPVSVKKYNLTAGISNISLNKSTADTIDTEFLWKHLIEHGKGGTDITAGDILAVWYSKEAIDSLTEKEKTAFLNIISKDEQHFTVSFDKTQVYIKTEEEAAPQMMDQAAAREFLMGKLKEYDIKTVSFIEVEKKAVLKFKTLKHVNEVKQLIPELEKSTLWEIEISDIPDWDYITNFIKDKFIEEGITLSRNPSISGNRLIVKLEEKYKTEKAEELAEILSNETGIEIVIDAKNCENIKPFSSIRNAEGRARPDQITKLVDELINSKIADQDFKVKASMYQDECRIVLGFVAPEYAERFRNEIEELQEKTKWQVEVSPNYKTNILIREVVKIAESFDIKEIKAGFKGTYAEVKIPAAYYDEGKIEKIRKQFKEKTGVEVVFRKV
ncbi:MBL fold metallo-hydrolase [Thermoanaerobacter mathranii]|uniref:MBL fold metallo-hydrolase n=1 Tax=Thermoanaerobacter mathranii TaxID=583357 RepID=UPI003D6B80D8